MEQSEEASRDNPASDARRDLTGHIIAAFYLVKRELGPGLPEYVYANAMAVALSKSLGSSSPGIASKPGILFMPPSSRWPWW